MRFVQNFGGQIETKYTEVLSVLHILILHDSPKVLKISNFMLMYFDTVKNVWYSDDNCCVAYLDTF